MPGPDRRLLFCALGRPGPDRGTVPVDPAQVTAGWAALGLGLGAGAAALGGLAGSALWSPRRTNGAQP